MDNIKEKLALCEQISCDTLTGKMTEKSVCIKSNLREIYIGINTIVEIVDFLKSKGMVI